MPEMDGFEAFDAIRMLNSQVPVIAQTAYAFTNEVLQIKEKGFNDYVSKPINPATLYSLISKYF